MRKLKRSGRVGALVLCMICLACLMTSLPSCRTRPPALAEVYDELVAAIDASVDVNVILFGAGQPVYRRDSAEEALVHRYYGVSDDGTEMVTEYARYATTADIEAAIRAAYSKAYADSLVETLLTGYALGYGDTSLLAARYTENSTTGKLHQSVSYQPLVSGVKIYNYATMAMEPASTSNYLKITVEARTDRPGSTWSQTTLTFVLENGAWRLDGPSC